MAGQLFWEKKCFYVSRLRSNESREGFCRGDGKNIPYRGAEDRKGAGTNSRISGTRAMEAESIRSRAESTGRCVKLKTVTEIRRINACKTFMAENVYLVLTSLWE